jgi:hypothetical protein
VTERERMILAAAPLILGAVFATTELVLPERRAAAQAAARVEELSRALEGKRGVALEAKTAAEQEGAQLAALAAEKRALDAARAELAAIERELPKDEVSPLAALSDLAATTGVVLRESTPVRGVVTVGTKAPAGPLASRPRRRLVVAATFGSLRAFVAGLPTLPGGRVHLERFECVAKDEGGLEATLVLVL